MILLLKFERLSFGILNSAHHQHPQSLLCHLAASLWRTVRAKSRRATVNSFITPRSFHVGTSAPKVPAEPCSAISSANALAGIVQMLTKDHHPGKCLFQESLEDGMGGDLQNILPVLPLISDHPRNMPWTTAL